MIKIVISLLLCFLVLVSCENGTKYQTIDENRRIEKENEKVIASLSIIIAADFAGPFCLLRNEVNGTEILHNLTTATSEKQNVRFRFTQFVSIVKVVVAEGQSLVFDSPAYNITSGNFLLYDLDSCPIILRERAVRYALPNVFFTASTSPAGGSNSQIFVAKKAGTYLISVNIDPSTPLPSTMTVYIK